MVKKMTELSLTREPDEFGSRKERRRRWWRRQFGADAGGAQIKFDVAFGIVLPLFCLYFDPIVFDGFGSDGGGLLERYQLFAYLVIASEVLTLVGWLALGKRAGVWRVALGSIMLAGALFSSIIGLILLPFSLIGLLLLIGALGFAPFFSAFVYLRNGWRAVKFDGAGRPLHASVLGATVLGSVFVMGGCAAAQWTFSRIVSQSLHQVSSGAPPRSTEAVARLKRLNNFSAEIPDQIMFAYQSETDLARREHSARAYKEITGFDLAERLRRLAD